MDIIITAMESNKIVLRFLYPAELSAMFSLFLTARITYKRTKKEAMHDRLTIIRLMSVIHSFTVRITMRKETENSNSLPLFFIFIAKSTRRKIKKSMIKLSKG